MTRVVDETNESASLMMTTAMMTAVAVNGGANESTNEMTAVLMMTMIALAIARRRKSISTKKVDINKIVATDTKIDIGTDATVVMTLMKMIDTQENEIRTEMRIMMITVTPIEVETTPAMIEDNAHERSGLTIVMMIQLIRGNGYVDIEHHQTMATGKTRSLANDTETENITVAVVKVLIPIKVNRYSIEFEDFLPSFHIGQ
jgi:hypothetical protein